MTTGIVSDEARDAADSASLSIVDCEALAGLARSADVDVVTGGEAASSLAAQFAGHWPGPMRERAVEAAMAVEGVADFDVDVTRASGLTDVDFRHGDSTEPSAWLRFTETNFLVYVRADGDMDPVLRLSAYRDQQPPIPPEVADRVRSALEGDPG